MLPESDYRFDRELADWFSRRGVAWSGTAGELLASLRTSADVGSSSDLQSSGGLYVHLQSHRQILQSLGVDVLLHNGVPRMVSLRSCRDEPQRKPPSHTFDIDRKADPTISPSSLVAGRKSGSADSVDADRATSEALNRDIPVAKSDSARKSVTEKFADGNDPKEGFFLNTGEALFAMVEMRRQIREQGLDLEATVDLVIGRAQEITRSHGIAVGFLPEEIGRYFRTAMAPWRKQLDFDANLFQSSLVSGEAVPVPDAQAHPLLGARCRREGIGSLIMVPIFRNREVAGAIEFFFQEKRSFSPGDVMDLGLIAGVVSESLGGSKPMGVKRPSGPSPETKAVVNLELPGSLLKQLTAPSAGSLAPKTWQDGFVDSTGVVSQVLGEEEEDPGAATPGPVAGTIDSETPLPESSTPESMVPDSPSGKSATAPNQLWLRFKRAWTKPPRGM